MIIIIPRNSLSIHSSSARAKGWASRRDPPFDVSPAPPYRGPELDRPGKAARVSQATHMASRAGQEHRECAYVEEHGGERSRRWRAGRGNGHGCLSSVRANMSYTD